MEEKFAQIRAILALAEDDMTKFLEKGNKTAGTRLRKNLQQVRELSQDIRKEVLEKRK
ncbi:MAG: histone H1 [Sphingobacteriales bacterium BACL12 MAG-120813-bin55]|jgi:hypothetical protein|nr:MAG: histone H1 [Sphingobacteriales bacterium BACL12 MAG-120802-bin5]KRP11369.1 MAG: histone H1 [Sphingobacteriales bacterium BACL12 MAG-120813-bin55]